MWIKNYFDPNQAMNHCRDSGVDVDRNVSLNNQAWWSMQMFNQSPLSKSFCSSIFVDWNSLTFIILWMPIRWLNFVSFLEWRLCWYMYVMYMVYMLYIFTLPVAFQNDNKIKVAIGFNNFENGGDDYQLCCQMSWVLGYWQHEHTSKLVFWFTTFRTYTWVTCWAWIMQ